MRNFKFMCSLFAAVVLIVLPEPVTTALGLGLLSWAIVHYLGLPASSSGTCRCDFCRMGLSKKGHLSRETNNFAALLAGEGARRTSARRAQATLPLIKGKDWVQTNRAHNSYAKGGVAIM